MQAQDDGEVHGAGLVSPSSGVNQSPESGLGERLWTNCGEISAFWTLRSTPARGRRGEEKALAVQERGEADDIQPRS